MTRTVHVGRVSREERRWYEAVLEAQLAGIAEVVPGKTAGQVDQAARQVLRKAELDRYFTHSTGHGVGLEIHEPPRLGKRQLERLEPGMVITIEPGIYIPGKGGIRIEDMVVVTDRGCQVLTPVTKKLIEI
jgi:Xaa-Pro aminopeptidase